MTKLTQRKVRFPKIRNLMINRGGIMKDKFIFPRKYLKVIITYIWHGSIFMSSSALLNALFLLGCSTLAFHREMQVLEMDRELRKQKQRNCKAWKEKGPVWKILEKGNVTTYLKCLHG